MFDWNDLRYFLAVERHGSTLAAARALNVSQTTVTRRIAALEEALGTQLFERRTSGYVLAPSATILLELARETETSAEALYAAATASTRVASGVVRVTLDEIYSVTILAPVFRELRQHYPAIRIDLDTTGEVRDLTKGEADVAIRSCVEPDSLALVGRRLFPDNFSFYCSHDYAERKGIPRDVDELAQHDLIEGGGGGIGRTYSKWLASRRLDDAVVMHHNSAIGLLAAVKSGAGVAALPCLVANLEPDLVRCFPPARDNPSFLWLLTHERLRHAPHVRAVMDFVYPRLKPLGSAALDPGIDSC